ncbi:MAG: hypothetical protein QXP29_07280 [Candidatus Nezhaarchaeales archaeon]
MDEDEKDRLVVKALNVKSKFFSITLPIRLLHRKFSGTSIKNMLTISGVAEICRRYFVMNMFDGTLAALGVIIGMWVSGIDEPRIVIRTVLAAGLAMFFSGSLGAYLTEKAERERKIRELEEAMFQDIKGSLYERLSKLAVLVVSIIDGISPLIACIALSVPLMLSQLFNFSFTVAFLASLLAGVIVLGLLGFFLGRIAKKRPLGYMLYMMIAGVASAIVIVLLGAYI